MATISYANLYKFNGDDLGLDSDADKDNLAPYIESYFSLSRKINFLSKMGTFLRTRTSLGIATTVYICGTTTK